MTKKNKHDEQCACSSCHQNNNERRNFLKSASLFGLGMAAMGPVVAGTNYTGEEHAASIRKSTANLGDKVHRFTILHTADIHAQLYTHDEFFLENNKPVYKKRGGFGVLKSMINSLRNDNPLNTMVIDGGDCFQGGGVASLSKGEAIVPLINNIGYDLILPGNWEVVYGKEMMRKDLGAYRSNKICANMFHDTLDELKGEMIFQPYYMRMIAGLKVGFIGYNDPLTPKRQSPAYSEGISFTKPEKNVAKYIKILRDYEKCDLVFLLTHMGLAQQVDLGNKSVVDGVDYILGADTHERVRKPIETKYTKVTEPGAFGSFISRLEFVIEKGKIKDQSYELLDVDPEKYPADEEMNQLVETIRKPYREELDKVIGQSKTTLTRYYVMETNMDNMVTDALMWKLKPDVAISNGFRFCPPLVPDAKTGMVNITNDYLWSMLPVDSEAKRGEVTGQQLWDWMEKELHNVFAKDPAKRFGGWVVRFNGMEVNFTMQNDMGKRVNWIKIKGNPIDKNKFYTVAACEREGDPDDTLCRIEKVNNPQRYGATLHNIMREYLAKHSPVSPKIEGRVTATDAPSSLLSQLDGYDYEFR
jgi:S-sulfosulfanyl-L-cysteine sulfohydrolase